jgi:hypothetical protein
MPIEGDGSVVSQVRRLRGVRWDWSEDNPLGLSGPDMGVLAQEVEAVYPELIMTGSDGIKRVNYHGLVAPLIEAVKELDARVARLEAQLAPSADDPGPPG